MVSTNAEMNQSPGRFWVSFQLVPRPRANEPVAHLAQPVEIDVSPAHARMNPRCAGLPAR